MAVTVGLGETSGAEKVMTQEWLPTLALALLTDAVRDAGVEPAAELRVNQARSGPNDDVKLTAPEGLLLLIEIVWAAGTVPPVVYVPNDRVEEVADIVVGAKTVKATALLVPPAAPGPDGVLTATFVGPVAALDAM